MFGEFSLGQTFDDVTAAKSSSHSLAPDMSTKEQCDAGLVTQWDTEEELGDDDQGMTDAQWAAIAKVQWSASVQSRLLQCIASTLKQAGSWVVDAAFLAHVCSFSYGSQSCPFLAAALSYKARCTKWSAAASAGIASCPQA